MRADLARRAALICFVFALAGCATPPAKDELAPWSSEWSEAVIASEPPAGTAAIKRAVDDPMQLRFAQRVAALDSALTGRPLVPGNEVDLLIDGPQTHAAQLDAIRKARHHVHLAVYILTGDDVGQRYLAALSERARAGVKVRVLFDAVGSRPAGDAFRDAFREAGVELYEFGPLNPLAGDDWQVTRRQHRKILVVDGRTAFTGGVNVSDQYSSAPGGGRNPPGWRDTNIRIRGPAAAEFQKIFLAAWEAGRGAIEPSPAYFPKVKAAGDDLVRAVESRGEDLAGIFLDPLIGSPDTGEHAIYGAYLAAMSEARRRIWITQSYFVPNDEFVEVLVRAARRGVDVRLLLPGYTDIGLMLHASRNNYDTLLDAGVRVYEYQEPESMMHAKTAVIDGVWSTVGSSNLDYRSFIHNDEANAIVISSDFARQMERMFRDDLERSREVTHEAWQQRPLRQRLLENLTVLFEYWI